MTQRSEKYFSSQTVVRWSLWLAFLVLCVLVGLLAVGFVRMAWREHEVNQMIAHMTALNEAQRAENERLEAEAQYRESDAYAELAAREQLGMAREGETVLLPTMVTPPLADSAPDVEAPAAASEADEHDQPNYRRWWEALFPSGAATP